MNRIYTILLFGILGILCSCSNPSGSEESGGTCELNPIWGLWVPVQDQYDSATITHFLPWLEDGQEIPLIKDTIAIDSEMITVTAFGVKIELVDDTMYQITGSDPILGTLIKTPYKYEIRGEDTLCFTDTTFANPSTGYFNKYLRVDHKKLDDDWETGSMRYWKQECYHVPECFWEE